MRLRVRVRVRAAGVWLGKTPYHVISGRGGEWSVGRGSILSHDTHDVRKRGDGEGEGEGEG